MNPRSFVAAVLLAATPLTAFAARPPVAEATIDELQARMAAGRLSARDLTKACLRRIAEVDRAGPKLNSVIELNPDALAIAAQLDAERKAGRVRGPLHGIPVLIKDNIATADRMETTAGSLALVGAKPPRDAHIVTRLREAGAVILGKTNLSEWANFRSTESTSAWSGRGGLTLNPYALDRTASGSSSGSATAVAAGMCVVAVGTETNGSIISPSSQGGLVGIKPTIGLVSRTGIIPISASHDTAGPMTRTVRDAAILLGALAGADPADTATRVRPAGAGTDFALAIGATTLKGARLGVFRQPFGMRPGVEKILASALETLRAGGAELIELGDYPTPDLGTSVMTVHLYEFKDGINAYLATLGPNAPMKSLADLIAFNNAHAAQEMPLFGQQVFERAQAKGPLTDAEYVEAREKSTKIARGTLDALLNEKRLDAFVAVANGPAGLVDPIFGGHTRNFGSGNLAAVAGYPNVTVPAGQVAGLPVGLSFSGRAWSEAKLIAFAADFESRTKAWRAPKFLPTAEKR